jgi:endoglucanase
LDTSDFDVSLAQAIASAPKPKGVEFDGAKTLTFSRDFAGTFSFSRTLRSSPKVGSVHQVRLYKPETVRFLQPTAVALVGSPPLPRYPSIVRGVNASGGEFGTVPGRYETHYIYPSRKEIVSYARQGFTVVRLPFRWERVQHRFYGRLDERSDGSGDMDYIRRVVSWITGEGMIAVLDPHDFGSRRVGSKSAKIGSLQLPTSAFEDLWVRLARRFKSNDRVWFNLMNEPHGVTAQHWKMVAQSATNVIRGTGALNRILVPGTSWSGAHSWVSSGNAAAMAGFVDPAHNYAFDVHQYLDSDSSGTHGTCVAGVGSKRLDPFIDWAREKPGRYGFLGEFAAGDPAVRGQERCAIELHALLDDVEKSGVFIGWTAWGAGAWWGSSYIFRLKSGARGAHDTNYMKILKGYLR